LLEIKVTLSIKTLVNIVITLFFSQLVQAQTTLYSEDFENAAFDNKGQDGATFDVSGVTNWSVDMTGSVSMSGSDRFKQMSAGYFESFNTDAPSTNPIDWFTTVVNISGYSNVSPSVDLSRNSSNSGSGIKAFYSIDGGAWVQFGSLIGSAADNTASTTGLSGSTIQLKIEHWGTSSTPSYRHDNVVIIGTAASCGANTSPTNLVVTPDETTMDISWDDPTTGDAVIVIMRETVNAQAGPVDGTSYSGNTIFESGDQLGSSQNYVIYSGNLATNSLTISNLVPNTSYTIDVYSSVSATPCYFLTEISDVQSTLRATNYYINDATFDASDVFTLTAGDNTKDGLLPSTPKLSLTNLLSTYGGTFLPGDSIFIDAGSYNDRNQEISDAGVNIVGAGSELTIFDNNQAGATGYYFIQLNADDVTMSDLTIQEYGSESAAAHAIIIGNGSTSVTGIEVNYVIVNNNGRSVGNKAIGILANSSSTFNGGGTTCNENWISAGNFLVTGNNINLTIKNYSLIEAEYGYDGGAIRMESGNATQVVTISNSYFYGNDVHTASSGADLYMTNGTLTVTDCKFENSHSNFATNEVGGSIKIAGGTATFKRSIFIDHTGNLSDLYGAGIGITNGTVTIDSCKFSGNSGGRGNDVYIEGGSVTCFNCTFSSAANQIGQSGGGSFTISNSGNPSVYGTVTKTNTTAPSYTPTPNIPVVTGDCASGITLPIELANFSGSCSDGGILLNWETTSEINNDYFILEKMVSSDHFEEIAIIQGAGTSNSSNQYSFVDNFGHEEFIFYRLKQVDFNGDLNEHKIIKVEGNCSSQENNIYYNSQNHSLILKYSGRQELNSSIDIYDITGKLITKHSIILKKGVTNYTVPLNNNIKQGIFLFSMNNKYEIITKRIIIP